MSGDTRDKQLKPVKRPMLSMLEYIGYVAIESLLRILPLKWAYLFTEGLVYFLVTFIPRVKSRMIANLHIAYGSDLAEKEMLELLDKSVKYHAWFIADMVLAPYLLKKARYSESVDASETIVAMREAGVYSDKGILLVSSHQGAPDIISLSLGQKGFPLAVVARPLDNPHIQRRVSQVRESYRRIQISKTGALRPAYRHLKDKGIVGIQIDQDAGPAGLFVPYFSKLASTHSGPGTLANLTDAQVLMVFCIRTKPRSFSFKLYTKPLSKVQLREIDESEDAILSITGIMTEEIEIMARRFPEQVMWAHRRWKTRPPQESAEIQVSGKLYSPRIEASQKRNRPTAGV